MIRQVIVSVFGFYLGFSADLELGLINDGRRIKHERLALSRFERDKNPLWFWLIELVGIARNADGHCVPGVFAAYPVFGGRNRAFRRFGYDCVYYHRRSYCYRNNRRPGQLWQFTRQKKPGPAKIMT